MSAYMKFVCYFCGDSEIEIETDFEDTDSIESVLTVLWDFGWSSSDGYMCYLCRSWNE